MNDNIFAYTAPGADWPEYLSVNDRDGCEITVRSKGGGAVAVMVLPLDQINGLANALQEYKLHVKRSPEERQAHARAHEKAMR